MIFDTHSHYDDDAFSEDRDELIRSLPEYGIGKVVDVGASVESCHLAQELAHRYEYVYCALGVHPTEIGGLMEDGAEENRKWLKEQLLTDPKCVALGEIGLDYYWDDTKPEDQKKWFEWQLELAREVKKPVIIHSREAAKDTADIMRAHRAGEIGGVVHCYSYSKEMAREFLDMDFYFGIGGVLTYKNARKLVETVEYLPLERIVLETDCPYLSPVPNRGKRNSSLNIPYIVTTMSQIKGISEEEIINMTWKNAHRLYRMQNQQ